MTKTKATNTQVEMEPSRAPENVGYDTIRIRSDVKTSLEDDQEIIRRQAGKRPTISRVIEVYRQAYHDKMGQRTEEDDYVDALRNLLSAKGSEAETLRRIVLAALAPY